jgi:hypothetical protein
MTLHGNLLIGVGKIDSVNSTQHLKIEVRMSPTIAKVDSLRWICLGIPRTVSWGLKKWVGGICFGSDGLF